MIPCEDLVITQELYRFFLPEPLIKELGVSLQKARIAYTERSWCNFVSDPNDPTSILPQYLELITGARQRYEEAGYPTTARIGAIELHVYPKDIFQKTLLLFEC